MRLLFHLLLVLSSLFYCTVPVQSVDSNEACPVFPQVIANPNTVHTQESPIGQRAWVVLLWVSCGSKTSTCEGALIRRDWVMTTSKCLPCGTEASVVADVGLHYNKIRNEIMLERQVERIGAYGIHLYTGGIAGDSVALIHLTKKLNNSYVIDLVECSQRKLIHQTGRNCLSAGWGDSIQYSTYDTKPMADTYMGIWSDQSCSIATRIGKGVICAGAKLYSNITSTLTDSVRGVDESSLKSCYVQLGAALVVSQPKVTVAPDGQADIICQWQLCGVLTRGMSCGMASVPGVYADVCEYENWIGDTIRTSEEHLLNLEGCPTLPSPPVNGYLCGLEDVASGKVQFCCERGYQLSGPSVSVCDRSNRQWNPMTGKCLPVSCPELPTPLHANSKPKNCKGSSYTMGCWFNCDSGYTLKGVELISCQEDATWSNGVPNCEVIDCGPPPATGNIVVDYAQTTYQSVASYQCKTCYELPSGNVTVNRTCDSTGNWIGSFPICKLVHCEQLTAPLYGRIYRTSDTCGSQVRFECMEGFVMLGNNRATCLPSGQWSSSTPFCVSASCPHPVVDNSVNFLPPTPDNPPPRSYSYGDVVSIRCQECHRAVGGSVKMTCLQGGVWDASPPICEWVTCPLPSLLPNGQIFPLGNMYFCGTHVRFRCYPGYNLIGSPSTHCGESGEWSHPFPACKSLYPERECSLFKVNNGKVSITHTGAGGMANVSCSQCYSLEGSNTLKCTENMEWDKPLPSCKLRRCPDLGAIANGYIVKQTSDSSITCNDVIVFGCNDGFTLDGHIATTCLYNGRWSHPTPTCRAIRCQQPPSPTTNSFICAIKTPDTFGDDEDGSGADVLLKPQEYYPPGSIIEYCCEDGTVIMDNEALICTESGEWSPQAPPRCKMNGCPLVNVSSQVALVNTLQPHTLVSGGIPVYPNGSILNWMCKNSALVLYGSQMTTCQIKNRQFSWSHQKPQCINATCFQTCPNPYSPDNGRIVSVSNNKYMSRGGISEGTVVVYLCNRDYHLHGSISRKCLTNGVWSGQETMCLSFRKPDSKVIVQNPETKQWQSVSAWHFKTSQQIYLACQTFSGLVTTFRKVKGPRIDHLNVRVSEFGDEVKSRQLLLKPMNPEGAKSVEGTYMCQVKEGENMISRTVDVFIHEQFCPFSNNREESRTIFGQAPGSCHHIVCEEHQKLTDSFRICLNDGSWSGPSTSCVLG